MIDQDAADQGDVLAEAMREAAAMGPASPAAQALAFRARLATAGRATRLSRTDRHWTVHDQPSGTAASGSASFRRNLDTKHQCLGPIGVHTEAFADRKPIMTFELNPDGGWASEEAVNQGATQ